MIPIWLLSERGNFLALDLGGTNFRVLLIQLSGTEVKMENKIFPISQDLMVGHGDKVRLAFRPSAAVSQGSLVESCTCCSFLCFWAVRLKAEQSNVCCVPLASWWSQKQTAQAHSLEHGDGLFCRLAAT